MSPRYEQTGGSLNLSEKTTVRINLGFLITVIATSVAITVLLLGLRYDVRDLAREVAGVKDELKEHRTLIRALEQK